MSKKNRIRILFQNIIVLGLIFFNFSIRAQEANKYKILTIAFYNLENIFDIYDDPLKYDESSPIMAIKMDREKVYRLKIANMAKVIGDLGHEDTHNAPVILGLAEVENRKVLEDIVSDTILERYDYGIIHYDSPDIRGIDVSLIYQKSIFRPIKAIPYELKIYDAITQKRIYTRDVLLVSGMLEDEIFYFLVNHWPSRRGGQLKSETKRLAAARLNKLIIDSLQMVNPYAKLIIMGDFNDDPTDKSIMQVLGAKQEISKTGIKGIYNPMIKLKLSGYGSNAYLDKWSLFDQIMISNALTDKNSVGFKYYKAGIFNRPYLTDRKGRYKGYPFRSFSNNRFTGGYSDHFPVYLYLIKAVK